MKTMVVLWGLMVPCFSVAQAELRVECTQGCEPRGDNQSVNLLLRTTESVPVMIRWATNENPQAEGRILTLYAGNPTMQEAIPDRGALTFSATTQGEWEATRQFSGTELGRGTFLAVVTQRPQGSEREASGENESILDWRAFRLLTAEEQRRKQHGVSPGGAQSVSVAPGLLRASSGHGLLPRARGGDKPAWWSLAEIEGRSDLDLDGEQSGIPGLTIQVSTPWHSSATEDWKATIQQNLTSVKGHQVRFGDLEWREQPDRTIALGADKRLIEIRHYYTVVTLFTNATVKSFDDKEVGANHVFISPTYFSHETSARLKHTDDPRFWASYSRREYSADQRLLSMLQSHVVARVGTVPGLGDIQQDDGDGGAATYTAGFYATVRPWESPGRQGRIPVSAGFIALDVVAARAGIGGLVTEGSAGTSSLERIWCQVIRCGTSGHTLDMDKPPSGYQVTQPDASLDTFSGELPMIQEPPELAERKTLPEDALPALPTSVRFAVSANLRSGALLQEAWLGHIKNIVPINTYAQFVVKMTVAMVPNTDMVTTEEQITPRPAEFRKMITMPPNDPWAWLTEHPMLWIAALTGGVALLLVFVPGGITVLRSIMGVITQALQLIVDLIALILKKLAALVHRNKPGD